MGKNEFRRPLLQSAAVLVAVIILATIAASSGSGNTGGGFLAIVAGIGNTVLFAVGLAIGLGVSIALLIGIFLAAVAMVSPQQASEMYSDLKKNFSQGALICCNSWSCDNKSGFETQIDFEEHNRMKQEIFDLQKNNSGLSGKIIELEGEGLLYKERIADLQSENLSLKDKIEVLGQAVKSLKDSENDIRSLVADLTTKIQSGSDPEMIAQIKNLERLQLQTKNDIESIIERLNTLEIYQKQSPTSGIFSYIDNEKYQALFIEKVEEALKQEMTYAQIDDYLSTMLPPALDKIIKDHPSLTKNYIRNLRRD
ncbi:MAG: hypothetical protein KJ630_02445 [Proteobacteria bacterium]|nr:hypothetical protein [Pseudomonadota bacterium]